MMSQSVKKNLLILEDDESLLKIYQELLGGSYGLLKQKSLKELNTYLDTKCADSKPDLLIADLNLADGSFLDFLKADEAKKIFDIPFLVVSNVEDEDCLNECFDEGAIDYLVKPFSKSELTIKINRAIDASSDTSKQKTVGSGIEMDPTIHELKKDGKMVAILTTKEMQVFNLLFKSPGEPVKRTDIETIVWRHVSVTPKSLDVHVFNLRKKIFKAGLEIKFVKPDGYMLVATSTANYGIG